MFREPSHVKPYIRMHQYMKIDVVFLAGFGKGLVIDLRYRPGIIGHESDIEFEIPGVFK